MENATVTLPLEEFDALREQVKSGHQVLDRIDRALKRVYKSDLKKLESDFDQCEILDSESAFNRIMFEKRR